MAKSTAQIAPTATINVTYNDGFNSNPQAKVAFQYAVNIWETLVKSPVTIEIEANWTPLDLSETLADAGPYISSDANFSGTKVADTRYPTALTNSLAGTDRYTTQGDITASFNSNVNWYFGTDGNTPAGKYDFASVVLHELAHGFGFVDLMEYSSGKGSELGDYAYIYDRFIENGGGKRLLDFSQSTIEFGNQLTSNNLFFDAPKAIATNGGRPKLYAPGSWEGGSSIGHLDETTYDGTINALMTPFFNSGEAIHQLGPIVFGMFQDLGWKMNTEGWIYGTPGGNSLTGTSATQNIYGLQGNDSLKGLAGDDFIDGGSGNDLLDGGTDDDDLSGKSGNDTYVVDSFLDDVTEDANQGIDTVRSATFWRLGDNLENLTLTGSAFSGTGNSLNNKLIGNDSNNSLNGAGGRDTIGGRAGFDFLKGDLGNDTLYGGDDYDSITGGPGNDRLVGGAGADRLTGSSGQDYFAFKAKTEGKDTITDFSVTDDTIWVSKAGFGGGLVAGASITTAQFRLGTGADDASDRIIYNKSTGSLSFDVDGQGGIGQVQLAQISTGLNLTKNDIVVIA